MMRQSQVSAAGRNQHRRLKDQGRGSAVALTTSARGWDHQAVLAPFTKIAARP
jgi:hypothetical protein